MLYYFIHLLLFKTPNRTEFHDFIKQFLTNILRKSYFINRQESLKSTKAYIIYFLNIKTKNYEDLHVITDSTSFFNGGSTEFHSPFFFKEKE